MNLPALSTALPYLFILFGILSRVFVPWLITRRDDNSIAWSWRLVVPQLVGVLVILLMLPVLLSGIDSFQELGYTAAYLSGWAAADLGRQADKLILKRPS